MNTYFIDDFYNNERKIVFFEIVRKIFQILPKTIFEFVVVSSVLIFILLNENNIVKDAFKNPNDSELDLIDKNETVFYALVL